MTPTTTSDPAAPDAGTRPKILEAADCSFGGPSGADFALTCEWPDGTETLEHVSEHAARLLGYDPDENGDPRDDAQCPACNGTGAGQGDSDRCCYCGGDGSVLRIVARATAPTPPDAGRDQGEVGK